MSTEFPKRKRPLSTHALRTLGALTALTDAYQGKRRFFKRWEMGQVVYGQYSGVQVKTMATLWSHKLVEPESLEAVALYQYGSCTCGCDRWGITEAGRSQVLVAKVKVPVLARPGPVRTPEYYKKFFEDIQRLFGLKDTDDPADWWKKSKDDQ